MKYEYELEFARQNAPRANLAFACSGCGAIMINADETKTDAYAESVLGPITRITCGKCGRLFSTLTQLSRA